MARRRAHPPLNVLVNGRHAGVLRRESTGAIDFTYADAWLAWPDAFPISLSLPLREDRYIGAAVTSVFDNLLPDNADIRRKVAERVGAAGTDAFSLLAAIGRDCVGALQLVPDGDDPGPAGGITGERLTDAEIADILANLADAPLGLRSTDDFRISLAGAQEKTALLRRDDAWFRPSGGTATTHILKPQIGMLPNGFDFTNSVENEYFCLKLLGALSLPVADAEIVDFAGRVALVVERFDRLWTTDGRLLRLPQEDCCQALGVPPTQKYQSEGGPGILAIADLLRGGDTPDEDILTFFRANVLFWLLGATDGHAKNFSVFLFTGGRYRLTPLYDVLTTQSVLAAGKMQRRQFRLSMSVGKSHHYAISEITPRHFLETAAAAGISDRAVAKVFEDLRSNLIPAADRIIQALPRGFPAELVETTMLGLKERAALLSPRGA